MTRTTRPRTVDQRRWFMVTLALLAWVIAGFAIDSDSGVAPGVMTVLWVAVGALALASVWRPSLSGVALVAMMPLATVMWGWSLVGGIDYWVTGGVRGNPIGVREAFFYTVDMLFIFATTRLAPEIPVAGDDGGE